MKANELRIGNLVCDIEQKEVDKIVGIEEKRVSVEGSTFAYTPIDEILPIELTEEWLIKFGFRIGRKNYSLNSGRELHEYACTDYFIIWHNIKKGWCINEFPDSNQYYFQYVHQLQNLYFALTGEELKQIEL